MADVFPGLKVNDVAYDMAAKEIVKITNCICVLPHTHETGYAEAHKRIDGSVGCTMVPCEAAAWRLIGVDKAGFPIMAWTYRAVDHTQLRPVSLEKWIDVQSIRKANMIGRV